VGCVSNFSNFLDLCRKTLRNLEVGVPVVVLSRSNTTQHMYRWFLLLDELLEQHGVEPGMLSYVSASIEQQRRIMHACPSSPLYLTGSRPVAQAIKDILPNTFSSTGGPNTFVAAELTPQVATAIRDSATIENSGQCTALRHVVLPQTLGAADFEARVLGEADVALVGSSLDSLKVGGYAGLFREWGESHPAADGDGGGYVSHSGALPANYRINASSEGFPAEMEENWRRVFVDVSSPVEVSCGGFSAAYLDTLCEWLTAMQPITLAVNALPDERVQGYPTARALWENSSQVVVSVGTTEAPAGSCQARPQVRMDF